MDGCSSGFSEYYKTWNERGYFDVESGFCLCLRCAEKGRTFEKIHKWYGYYKYDGRKHSMHLKTFFVSMTNVFGHGKDDVGAFYIKGSISGEEI